MLIVDPTNIDYLIPDVRLRIGDLDGLKYSDTVIRTCIVGAVSALGRRWGNRYLVHNPSGVVDPLPEGYVYAGQEVEGMVYSVVIPTGYLYYRLPEGYGFVESGLAPNDVFRNPLLCFPAPAPPIINQPDDYAINLMACIILITMMRTSSVDTLQSWSDGEFSFSNLGKGRGLDALYKDFIEELNNFFKRKLASSVRLAFAENYIKET